MSTSAKFKYKWNFITTEGHADIDISDISFDLQIGLSQQAGNPDHTLAPAVTVKNLNLGVSSSHTHVSLHGDILTEIAKLLEPLF